MGYYTLTDRNPWSSVGVFEKENEYMHEYSLEEIGKRYTFLKLDEFMTLDDYLNKPAFIIDDLLKGMQKGKEERYKLEEEYRKQQGELTPEQALAKQLEQMDKQK